MVNAIIFPARQEQQALARQLATIDSEYAAKKKPIVQRLEAVKSLLAAYEDVSPVLEQGASEKAGFSVEDEPTKVQAVRQNSHKARVLTAAIKILTNENQMTTRDLLGQMERQGIQFNAANKAGNLSVILSKDNRFVSDRRSGWSLADRGPQDVGAFAGLSKAEAVSQSIAPNRV